MTLRSTIQLSTSSPSDRVVLCVELPSPAHLLLWGIRRLIADRLQDRQVALTFDTLLGEQARRVLILLRTWLAEIALQSQQRIRIGTPCCHRVDEHELRLLAALERAQRGDNARCQLVLQTLTGVMATDMLAEIACQLGEALLSAQVHIDVASVMPAEAMPRLH